MNVPGEGIITFVLAHPKFTHEYSYFSDMLNSGFNIF